MSGSPRTCAGESAGSSDPGATSAGDGRGGHEGPWHPLRCAILPPRPALSVLRRGSLLPCADGDSPYSGVQLDAASRQDVACPKRHEPGPISVRDPCPQCLLSARPGLAALQMDPIPAGQREEVPAEYKGERPLRAGPAAVPWSPEGSAGLAKGEEVEGHSTSQSLPTEDRQEHHFPELGLSQRGPGRLTQDLTGQSWTLRSQR